MKNLFLNKLEDLITSFFSGNENAIEAINKQDLKGKLILISGFAEICGNDKVYNFCIEMSKEFKISL